MIWSTTSHSHISSDNYFINVDAFVPQNTIQKHRLQDSIA